MKQKLFLYIVFVVVIVMTMTFFIGIKADFFLLGQYTTTTTTVSGERFISYWENINKIPEYMGLKSFSIIKCDEESCKISYYDSFIFETTDDMTEYCNYHSEDLCEQKDSITWVYLIKLGGDFYPFVYQSDHELVSVIFQFWKFNYK